MLSLVYNRGSSLKGDSRKEMKQIQQAFKAENIRCTAIFTKNEDIMGK